jgi:calmodulin
MWAYIVHTNHIVIILLINDLFSSRSLQIIAKYHTYIGTITIVELKEVMRSLGQNPTDKELKHMINSVDDNGDNEIDFEEFLVLMSSKKGSGRVDPDRELRDAFKVFDKDGNGTISKSELKILMQNLGQRLSDEELEAMMGEVDTDGNGEIDFDEFKQMMVSSILACNW